MIRKFTNPEVRKMRQSVAVAPVCCHHLPGLSPSALEESKEATAVSHNSRTSCDYHQV